MRFLDLHLPCAVSESIELLILQEPVVVVPALQDFYTTSEKMYGTYR